MLIVSAALAGLSVTPWIKLQVVDRFEREVTTRGVTLLDWEGHLANPAIRLSIILPKDIEAPADLHISGTSPRIHFDRSDPEDRTGIGKRVRLLKPASRVDFHVSIFPDLDGEDERHELLIQLFTKGVELSRLRMPVRVIDQDRPDESSTYNLNLDFSQDLSGYFSEPGPREIVRRAAADWAYFIQDPGYDPIAAGDEVIQLWGLDGFKTARRHTIAEGYRGYRMFISGIRHDELRAGGAPSRIGKFHVLDGVEQTIRRSGSVEFDVRGNWNELGWFLGKDDGDWWKSGNLRNEPSDLYSIALHEMGHALAFHRSYPVWDRARAKGVFAEPAIVDYHGKELTTDTSDHLPGAIDPISLYGSFGHEYNGLMKARRWLLTKSHLIALQVMGYRLRPIAALEPLALVAREIEVDLQSGASKEIPIRVRSGIPDYRFEVVEGKLPRGLELDEWTGVISGKTDAVGVHRIVVEVQDCDPTSKPVRANIVVRVKG